MSLSLIAALLFGSLNVSGQPENLRWDQNYLDRLKQSAGRIQIIWFGKAIDRVPDSGLSQCARDILTALLADRAEISSGGTLVNNGQRIGTRHRFLYPLDVSVKKLSARLSRNKEGRLNLTVQAWGENDQKFEPPLFEGNVFEKTCEPLPIDLIRWMELAGPAKPKVPAGEANR